MLDLRAKLYKQGYRFLGNYSAVKICYWVKNKLTAHKPCYKELFYGIECHRCLQITPALNHCTQNCIYCWRYQESTDTSFVDDLPETLLENAILAQRELLTGFKGNEKCDINLWKEAQNPKHVAISLSGEPTLYKYLSDFIQLCKKRNFTTFLVTNGTLPNVLIDLNTLPTQLYISVSAPTKKIYNSICRPLVANGFEKLLSTLQLLQSLSTRTVIRHTLVNNMNMCNFAEYATLDKLATPDFIECKAYMLLGASRNRLSINNMPKHEQVHEFGKKISELTGYEICAESSESRVVLLTQKSGKNLIISEV